MTSSKVAIIEVNNYVIVSEVIQFYINEKTKTNQPTKKNQTTYCQNPRNTTKDDTRTRNHLMKYILRIKNCT